MYSMCDSHSRVIKYHIPVGTWRMSKLDICANPFCFPRFYMGEQCRLRSLDQKTEFHKGHKPPENEKLMTTSKKSEN